MTPAVETATRMRSGLRGSTTMEWMPGANSPPSEAGVPNHFVSRLAVAAAEEVAAARLVVPQRQVQLEGGAAVAADEEAAGDGARRRRGLAGPKPMTQSLASVAGFVEMRQPTPNSAAASSYMSCAM